MGGIKSWSPGKMSLLPDKFTTAGSSIFAAVLAGGLIVSVLGFQITRNLEEKTIYISQQRATALFADALHERMELSISILIAIRGLFLASERVSSDEFGVFTQAYLQAHPELQALEWVPRILPGERIPFEQQASEDTSTSFQITEQDSEGQLIRASQRNQYFPVVFIQPLKGNEKVLGFDLGSNQTRLESIKAAAKNGQAIATPAIKLVQDSHKNNQQSSGVLLFLPVYQTQDAARSVSNLRGLVLGVFRVERLFNLSLEGLAELKGLDLTLADATDPIEATYLAGSPEALVEEHSWVAHYPIDVAGRTWRVTTRANRDYIDNRRTPLPDTVLITGFLLTTVLSFYLWSLVRRERQVRKLVDERTLELNASRKRMSVILENAADAVITIDGHGIVQLFNPAAENMFCYSADEVIGRNVNMLMPEPYHAEHDQYLANYHTTGQKSIIGIGREVVAQRKDGSTLPVHLSVGDATTDENRLYVGVLVDLTLRKAHEQALVTAKEAAEQASRQKSSFLNMMSHELRTPLTVILGYLPLLQNSAQMPEPEMIANIANDMDQSGRHLLEIINDLLDISKIEAGQMLLKPEKIDVRQTVTQVLNEFTPLAQEKGLSLIADIQAGSFVLDPMRFRQILINLVGNALKFTEQGQIDVQGEIKGSVLSMRVCDTGAGIPAEDLPQLFDAFYQVDSTRTRKQGGSGLGLAITKRLIALQNGSIEVESEVGKGTVFSFTIVTNEG